MKRVGRAAVDVPRLPVLSVLCFLLVMIRHISTFVCRFFGHDFFVFVQKESYIRRKLCILYKNGAAVFYTPPRGGAGIKKGRRTKPPAFAVQNLLEIGVASDQDFGVLARQLGIKRRTPSPRSNTVFVRHSRLSLGSICSARGIGIGRYHNAGHSDLVEIAVFGQVKRHFIIIGILCAVDQHTAFGGDVRQRGCRMYRTRAVQNNVVAPAAGSAP